MVEAFAEKGMLVKKMELGSDVLRLGFMVKEEYLERSREEDFGSWLNMCQEDVDYMFIVSSLAESKPVCQKIQCMLTDQAMMGLDAADLYYVAGKEKICSVGRGRCTEIAQLKEEVCSLLERTYVKKERKKTAVLLMLTGDMAFLDATEAADALSGKLEPDTSILFSIQGAEKEGEIGIFLLVTEEEEKAK